MSLRHPACASWRRAEAHRRSSIASPSGECSPRLSRLFFPESSSARAASCQSFLPLREARSGGGTGIAHWTGGRVREAFFPSGYLRPIPDEHHETCSAAGCFFPNSARQRQTLLFGNGKKASALFFGAPVSLFARRINFRLFDGSHTPPKKQKAGPVFIDPILFFFRIVRLKHVIVAKYVLVQFMRRIGVVINPQPIEKALVVVGLYRLRNECLHFPEIALHRLQNSLGF